MNEFQQTFVLSMASNMAPELVNQKTLIDTKLSPIEQAREIMEKGLAEKIPAILSGMGLTTNPDVVWGPSVYIAPKDFTMIDNNTYTATASNTMVVFKTGDKNYTVAIAGTKPTSVFDQVTEDGAILFMVKWPYGSPDKANPTISAGTKDGLNILLQMTDPATGKTLEQYLGTTGTDDTVTITGHSLGGALAPALALALFGIHTNRAKPKCKAQVYATAGADVGNDQYCTYFSNSFPIAQLPENTPVWQQYNAKIWNSLDVVPHAWAKQNLKDILTIYQSSGLATPKYVECIINRVSYILNTKDSILKNPYYPMDSGNKSQFAGQYVVPPLLTEQDGDNIPVPIDLQDFVYEMLYQHINAYFIEFGLKPTSSISAAEAAEELFSKNILYCRTKSGDA